MITKLVNIRHRALPQSRFRKHVLPVAKGETALGENLSHVIRRFACPREYVSNVCQYVYFFDIYVHSMYLRNVSAYSCVRARASRLDKRKISCVYN